jgi:hypothetical protein
LKRYASSGPPSRSYASCAARSANGSTYRAIHSGPASTGSKPTSRISVVATCFAPSSSPQYTRLGRSALLRLEHAEQHLALHRAERGDDVSASNLLGKCLRAR